MKVWKSRAKRLHYAFTICITPRVGYGKIGASYTSFTIGSGAGMVLEMTLDEANAVAKLLRDVIEEETRRKYA